MKKISLLAVLLCSAMCLLCFAACDGRNAGGNIESNKNTFDKETEKTAESETKSYPKASVGLEYTSNGDGTCYVSGIGECKDTDIVIPFVSPSGDRVTSIGDFAFNHCRRITSVTIGNGVTSIGNWAFGNCYGLTGVYITDIAAWCNISFGDKYSNPLYYAQNLYLDTELLTDLIIPEGTTCIGDRTFEHCASLTNVTIPDSVTSIGDNAFYSCDSLTSIVMGNGVETIGYQAFCDCDNLMSVTIGNGVTSIGERAFTCCDKLIEVFNLSDVEIAPGSTSSGYVAYYAKNVYVDTNTESKLRSKDGYIFYCDDENEEYYLMCYTGDEIELVLPNDINGHDYEIYRYAFNNNFRLISITIPNGVTSIGSSAFQFCDKLIEICNLSDVEIVAGSTSNGYVANYAKNVYTDTNMRSKLCSKDEYIFYCDDENGEYYLMGYTGNDTDLVLPDCINEHEYKIYQRAFAKCDNITSIDLPNSVTSIGELAFASCSNLTSVVIGKGVTSIGDNAFYICTSLTSVEIPNNVTSIGDYTFYFCYSITRVTIGNGVMCIGERAFTCCDNLTEIVIGSGVTSIGGYAFGSCESLTTVNYTGSKEDWTKVSIASDNTPLTNATIIYNYVPEGE